MISKEIIQKELNDNLSIKAIARKYNYNEKTIASHMKKYGLHSSIGSQGARKHKVDVDYFDVIDTEEKAYWLGFIAADGCVYIENNGAYRFQINLKLDDKLHLERLNDDLESTYEIYEKNVNGSATVQLKINSKIFVENLMKHNIIPKKSLVITPPQLRKDLVRHFIRGYFDGDGCIDFYCKYNQRARYSFRIVGGIPMLEFINNELDNCCSIYNIKHSLAKTLETTKKENLINIYYYLYKDSSIYLSRKHDIFVQILSHFREI